MANAFQTTGASPGNIRETLGTHYTTPVGSMANSQEPLEPGAQLTQKQLYQREYYRKNREKLLEAQKMRDTASPKSKKERDHESYMKHRAARLAQQKEYRTKNADKIYVKQLEWQRANKDRVNAANRRCRSRYRGLVLDHYGRKCACPFCPETVEEFLELDHKNGDGRAHRESVGGSSQMLYKWVIDHDYPEDFQLLCSNCNKGKYNYGVCPHELKHSKEGVN